VAQDIVNWTPALQSAVATVDSTASLLAPPDAPIFSAATYGFDAASNLLVAQAKAYLANPSASALQTLQTQVVTFQQQVSAALLQAVKIVDPAGQAHALSVLQAVATIVNTISRWWLRFQAKRPWPGCPQPPASSSPCCGRISTRLARRRWLRRTTTSR